MNAAGTVLYGLFLEGAILAVNLDGGAKLLFMQQKAVGFVTLK